MDIQLSDREKHTQVRDPTPFMWRYVQLAPK